MFIAAFLSGSILPFSSELVMAGLAAVGVDHFSLLLWGTVGNTLGSVLNYYVGSLGKTEWITKYLHILPKKLERGMTFVHKYGAWSGLLAWLPVLGEGITVALGYLRVPLWRCTVAFALGKFIRYFLLLASLDAAVAS